MRIDARGLAARGSISGPRRLLPLSLLAHQHGGGVVEVLDRQIRATFPGRHDGRFAVRTGLPDSFAGRLNAQEQALYARVGTAPLPLDELLTTMPQRATLDRLVARVSSISLASRHPTPCMSSTVRTSVDADAARLGARLLARIRDGRGQPIAAGEEELARAVAAALTRQSCEVILASCLGEDGVSGVDPASPRPSNARSPARPASCASRSRSIAR